MCAKHYARWRAHGDSSVVISSFGLTKPRPVRIEKGVCYITLSNRLVAIVDECDAERVASRNWHASQKKRSNNTIYPATEWPLSPGKRRTVWLHRFIIGAPPKTFVDHINGDTLDCRRSNLRLATNAQNQANARKRIDNTTGFKGVAFCKKGNLFRAVLRVNGRKTHLGSYKTAEEAHSAYQAAALAAHGEFARTGQ